jgi:hypothetical protein
VLALAVSWKARRQSLEILCARGFRSPLRVQLSNRGYRRFDGHAALAVRHYLVPPTGDFYDFADLEIEPFNGSCHSSILGHYLLGIDRLPIDLVGGVDFQLDSGGGPRHSGK